MTQEKKLYKQKFLILSILFLLGSIYFSLDYFYNIPYSIEGSPIGKLFLAILLTYIFILCITTTLNLSKKRKVYEFILHIFMLPLMPIIFVVLLLQTRFLIWFTLPLIILMILVSVFTYSFHQLEFLLLGNFLNNDFFSYLNLLMITITFVHTDNLAKLLVLFIPNSKMPQFMQYITSNLLDKKPFMKIGYTLSTLLLILVIMEQIMKINFLYFIEPYKKVFLQYFITFLAIETTIKKWKSK